MSFAYAASWDEWSAAYEEREETHVSNATWEYRICVARQVEWKPLQQVYEYGDPYIHYEQLSNWSDGTYRADELEDKMVTRVGGMEHAFDLLFEFSWIVALGYYLSLTHGTAPLILAAMTILLIAFYRNVYDRFGHTVGKSLDMYGRFERSFRRIAGRRNLFNVHILLFVLLGVPFYAIVSIFCHALMTALIYACCALLHLHRLDRGSVG